MPWYLKLIPESVRFKFYRKLIVTAIGFGILYANKKWGVDLGTKESDIVEWVVAGLTLFGLWRVPNEPLPVPDQAG